MCLTTAPHSIRTLSGRYIDLANPSPDDVDIRDIAGALSKICRFGAQVERFYSVAEHSVHCALVAIQDGLPPDGVLAVLMHDAAEAYTGDMVKPLKIMMPDFRKVEDAVEAAIASRFAIDFARWKAKTREIDLGMLFAERWALFSRDSFVWTNETESRLLSVVPDCWSPAEAQERFLQVFNNYHGECDLACLMMRMERGT
jgi:hypothetical protein